MKRSSSWRWLLTLLTVLALVAAACSDDEEAEGDGAATDSTEECGQAQPINIGNLSSESGGVDLRGGRQALEAFIAEYNAEGGFRGCQLALVYEDGGTDAGATSAGARELVEGQDVVAMIGDMAVLDCLVNATYYAEQGVAAVVPAFDTSCYTGETTFPYFTGADTNLLPGLDHLVNDVGAERIAYVGLNVPTNQALGTNLAAYASELGVELVASELVATDLSDVDAAVQKVAQSDPDAVIVAAFPQALQAVRDKLGLQGIDLASVTFMASPGSYGAQLGELLGPDGEGVLVTVNNYVVETGNEVASKVVDLMADQYPDSPQTTDPFVGWTGGEILRQILEAVEGDLTRESFLAATRSLDGVDQVLAPSTLDFSAGPPFSLASEGQILELQADGSFEVVTDDFITVEVPS